MCVQCGTCVKNCPAGALSFDADGKVAFDPAKCVQCDTCIHVCPNDSSPRTCEMTPEEVYAKVKKTDSVYPWYQRIWRRMYAPPGFPD